MREGNGLRRVEKDEQNLREQLTSSSIRFPSALSVRAAMLSPWLLATCRREILTPHGLILAFLCVALWITHLQFSTYLVLFLVIICDVCLIGPAIEGLKMKAVPALITFAFRQCADSCMAFRKRQKPNAKWQAKEIPCQINPHIRISAHCQRAKNL